MTFLHSLLKVGAQVYILCHFTLKIEEIPFLVGLAKDNKAFQKSQMRVFAKNSALLILLSFVFAQDMVCQKRATTRLSTLVDGFLHLGFMFPLMLRS